ncbi:complex I subunit 4 family protein [Flaviflexus equikiangi]|uniref:NADH-quinone oxidoreductase subunit M n=1 Tax=Flaviflexus equikiangi TaxID=2758573 RepID=A0ABS2THF1_9ACTO|nr:NADH-quinone oxidoreductase subunit M [Flaviflexus equikiangi]MBM9433528.1 NADH-quinone oxidoreductase subunit M [Flaviflexus equikiangi]
MNTSQAAAFPWLTVLILVPLVAAIVLAFAKSLHRHAKAYGLAVSVLVLIGAIVAFLAGFDAGQAGTVQLAETYSWMPTLGVSIAWGVNGMSAVMIGLAVLLVPLVILTADSDRFLSAEEEAAGSRKAGYIGWVLVLESVMIAIFAAQDVFLFYVVFEAMLIPVYFLIGSYGGPKSSAAAIKFLLYSLAGGLIMLVGIVAVFVFGPGGPQGFLIANLTDSVSGSQTAQMLMFLSFFIAFAVKAPMFPVHTWLADATEQAPSGTSALLVGVLDKVGTYGMIAICLPLFPGAASDAALIIMIFAVISILWGGFVAIYSRDLMRLIAFTSVSHFGFMVMGIFSGSEVAMTGAILYMVAHGVGTAALFLIVGYMAKRGGSQNVTDYGGWQRVTPVLAGAFLIAGLATLSLPGLSGFVPEFMVLVGTFSVSKVIGGIAVIGVILAALYILLPYQRVFTGPRPDITVPDLSGAEKTVVGVLTAAMLALGFLPGPVIDLVQPVAEQAVVFLDSSTTSALTEGNLK